MSWKNFLFLWVKNIQMTMILAIKRVNLFKRSKKNKFNPIADWRPLTEEELKSNLFKPPF